MSIFKNRNVSIKRYLIGAVLLAIVLVVRSRIEDKIASPFEVTEKIQRWSHGARYPQISLEAIPIKNATGLLIKGWVAKEADLAFVKKFAEKDYPAFTQENHTQPISHSGEKTWYVRYDVKVGSSTQTLHFKPR